METNTYDSVSINMDVFDESNKPAAAVISSYSPIDSHGNTFLATNHDSSEARDLQATKSGDPVTGNSQRSSVDIEEIELVDMRCRVEIESKERELLEGDEQSPSKTRADLQLKKSSGEKEQTENSERLLSPMRQSSNPGSPRRAVLLNEQPGSTESEILLSPSKQRSSPTSPRRLISVNDQAELPENWILLGPMGQSSNPGSPRRLVSVNDQLGSSESGVLLSPSKQRSNPASPRKTVSSNDQSKSTLSVPVQPWKRQASPTKSKNKPRIGAAQDNDEYDDDDDEISMDSLLELLGTVRQYAKEIHEIYAPIKQDEEERIRKRNERNAKRKSKDKGKSLVCRSNSEVTSPTKHEVRVEIHTQDNAHIEDLRQKCSRQTKQDVLSHSRSHEPLPMNQVASLHVENEKLASTWPRGNRRPTSRERFWSDIKTSHQKSEKSSGSLPRPQIPTSWGSSSRVRQEKEILAETPQRSRKSSTDPLGVALTKSNTPSQKMLARQQSTKGTKPAERDHGIPKSGLPQISIIPASFDYKTPCSESVGGSLPSALADNNTTVLKSDTRTGSSQRVDSIPTAPVNFGNDIGIGRLPGPPQSGGRAAKSDPRAGLRKRTSVDKGLGHEMFVLEKY